MLVAVGGRAKDRMQEREQAARALKQLSRFGLSKGCAEPLLNPTHALLPDVLRAVLR